MKVQTKRLFAAVILTPLVVGLVGGFIGLLADGWAMAWYFSVATFVVTFMFTLAYGLPAHLILKRLGRTGVLYYLAAAVPAALFIDRLNAEYVGLQIAFDAVPDGIISPLTFIMLSAITAAIAWSIARPDKSEAGKAAL